MHQRLHATAVYFTHIFLQRSAFLLEKLAFSHYVGSTFVCVATGYLYASSSSFRQPVVLFLLAGMSWSPTRKCTFIIFASPNGPCNYVSIRITSVAPPYFPKCTSPFAFLSASLPLFLCLVHPQIIYRQYLVLASS